MTPEITCVSTEAVVHSEVMMDLHNVALLDVPFLIPSLFIGPHQKTSPGGCLT